MSALKFAISVDETLVKRLDDLVEKGHFPSRSRAFQEALAEKLERVQKTRLAAECEKLDSKEEQQMADEFLKDEFSSWPKY